jgi:hypothetical protein
MTTTSQTPASAPEPPWTSSRAKAWYGALLLSLVLLSAAGFLLARLIWLPFYFGLFFFLVAGLLAGAIAFRLARAARPVPHGRILRGIVGVSAASTLVVVLWEYDHFAATVGDQPKFPTARNAAVKAGRPPAAIKTLATEKFKAVLDRDYPPGGPVGYVRWALAGGDMRLEVEGCEDTASISQRGYVWTLRTLVGLVLLAAGLWASFESLRSAQPVSNILAPGEECQED